MRTKKGRQEYFSILFEKLEWWHGDSWPIILAFRGNRPVYRTGRRDAVNVEPDHVVPTARLSTVEEEEINSISSAHSVEAGDDADRTDRDETSRDFRHLKTGS